MPNNAQLPRGIRNNNPGNLRRAVIHGTLSKVVEGFAVFVQPAEGLANLSALIHDYYDLRGLKTVKDFIARYAPSTENETLNYIDFVASRLAIPRGSEASRDMRLSTIWRNVDMMRAIIIMECGYPPPSLTSCGEWYSPSMLEVAAKVGMNI